MHLRERPLGLYGWILWLAACSPVQAGAGADSPAFLPPATVAQVPSAPTTASEPGRLEVPPEDLLELPSSGTCRVSGNEGSLVGALHLRVEGRRFATIRGYVKRADGVLEPTRVRVVVESGGITLGGEVLPEQLTLRPLEPLTHEGWLHVRRMRVSETSADGTLRGEVSLPALLADRSVQVSAGCGNASLTGHVEAPRGGQASHIDAASPVPLRLVPGGSAIATLRPPQPSGNDAIHAVEWTDTLLLERRGPWARIRIIGLDSWVEGWTAGGAVRPAAVAGMLGMLSGGFSPGTRFMTCPRELSVYVEPGTEPLRVGVASAGAKVRVRSKEPLEAFGRGEKVPVEVGEESLFWSDSEPALQPFVWGDSLAGCDLSS